jgi:F-type H+-transporting ATPase subunit b
MLNVDIVNKLIPNVVTLIVQLCSTAVLFLLAKKFLWKSVKKWMNARTDKMQADLSDCEKAKQDALADRQKAMAQLNEAGTRARDIVSAATTEANSQKDAILAQAHQEAENEKNRTRAQLEAERQAMYADMQKEMVDVALAAAGKLIGRQDGEAMDRQAVDAFVKETQTDGGE